MGFSRQEYWGGLPFPSPGDLPDPGIKLWSPALQSDSLPSEPLGSPLYPTRDRTWPLVVEVLSHNHWTTKELPLFNFKWPNKKGSIYSDNAEICPLVFLDPDPLSLMNQITSLPDEGWAFTSPHPEETNSYWNNFPFIASKTSVSPK